MSRATLLALLLAAAPALADDGHGHAETGEDHVHDDHAHEEDHDDHAEGGSVSHVTEAYGLRAVHAWTRATTGDAALVFLAVENPSEDRVVLTGASSDVAAGAEIVGFSLGDGTGSYAPLAEMPLPSGGSLRFAPQELAIRLTGLRAELGEGGYIEVTLATNRGPIPMDVEVGAADATGHSHAGHAH